MFVKICGMNDAEAVAAAVAGGADAVGFVFAASPREVSAERAAQLAESLPAHVLRVAVMHHPTQALVDEVCAQFAPDWLQTDVEDLHTLKLAPQCGTVLPVFRNGSAPPAGRCPPRMLFEGKLSGSGETADWDEARQLAQHSQLILAGGLNPQNVAAAIAQVRPWGVDVSSGVEHSRGRKDPARIHEFIARVRALESRND
jgi:phosphoribosylanthranilate isomerase